MNLYAAGIVGLETLTTQEGSSVRVKVDILNSPFLIKAKSYNEAVGICVGMLSRLRGEHPRYSRWEMYVNAIPNSPVDDPREAVTRLG